MSNEGRSYLRLLQISKVVTKEGECVLSFLFSDDTSKKTLDFVFPAFCEQAIVNDRCDAFLLAMYPICARRNIDIYSDIPASKDFYRKINALNAFLAYKSSQYHRITIKAETMSAAKVFRAWRLASGSLGVDSLHTLYVLDNNELYERPTHLVFNNTGSNEEGGVLHKELLQGRIENTMAFCKDNGYDFIFVDSNYKRLFEMRYGYTHLFVNASIAYMLGNSVSQFYVSSSGDTSNSLTYDGDPGHVDFVIYQ